MSTHIGYKIVVFKNVVAIKVNTELEKLKKFIYI